MQRQELESDNKKLKQELNELRKSLTNQNSALMPPDPGARPYEVLMEQLTSSYAELERSHIVCQEALKHKVRKYSKRECFKYYSVKVKLIRNNSFHLHSPSGLSTGWECEIGPEWNSLVSRHWQVRAVSSHSYLNSTGWQIIVIYCCKVQKILLIMLDYNPRLVMV